MRSRTLPIAAGLCLVLSLACGGEPSPAPGPSIPGAVEAGAEPRTAAPSPVVPPQSAPANTPPAPATPGDVRRPLGPDELPESLPGRWKVSLCVLTSPSHAWIRYENVETHEVRTISRFHLLVGGWFDPEKFHWNYGPTVRTGVYMDREQSVERHKARDKYLLLSAYVDNPKIYKGGRDGRGHGVVVNNCVTYTRDAWYFYTGEYYALTRAHDPYELRGAVLAQHPEVARRGKAPDALAPPPSDDAKTAVRGAGRR